MDQSTSTQKYLNREIGLLKFNKRVLYQSTDDRNPILDRVRFFNIFHSNLDEFFMKRVGGLKRQALAGVSAHSLDGLNPTEQLSLIRTKVLSLNEDVEALCENHLIPELAKSGIFLLDWNELTEEEKVWAKQTFSEKIFPVLTPMAVDIGHPFPLISNLSMSLAVSLKVPNEEDLLFARIKIPEFFPSWIKIPGPDTEFRMISCLTLVRAHLADLFPKMQIQNSMAFRVTRNVDIETDDEGAEDLLEMIEEEVKQRRFAEIVRLEHGPDANPWLLDFLVDELNLTPEDIFSSPLPLEFKQLQPIASLSLAHLRSRPWTPVTLPPLHDENLNIFQAIRNSDLLIHHPFESFTTSIERFIRTAASDPDVVAIKMTLYRTSEESPIVASLIKAAEEGKQVVCLVELKARFDEERNIYWAQAMEKAGVHVVYGIIGLKTHSKLALVVRREKDEFRSYVHIGTGNYHPQTAKLYTDFGLLTCKPQISREVVEVFHYLTGRSLKTDYKELLVSPINLKSSFLNLIQNEIENAKQQRPARIIAKCNNLGDKDMIEALYEASRNGVQVDLIIRGFSCLRPQLQGLSENIRLISVIGPFLEHSRVFYFRNAAADETDGRFFIGSADWMRRNLEARVEVVTPVEEAANRMKIWETLNTLLQDQRSAWDMDQEGNYHLRTPQTEEQNLSSQDLLAKRAADIAQLAKQAFGQKVIP